MKNLKYGIVALAIALLFSACGRDDSEPTTPAPASDEPDPVEQTAPATAEPMPADLESALADESRPAEDRARDASRKPARVVEFLGIEPGMKVLDVIAAGGYYTEVLSIAVGPEGQVVAQNPDMALEYNEGANEKAISARLANNRLPNVTRLNKNFSEMTAADGPFDAAITALNFHDVYNGSEPEVTKTFVQAIYDVLKPGGVFGVTDHVGVAGADNEALHRIEKSKVIEAVAAGGFELDGESDVLANPADDHTQQVFSDAMRGKTDRFVLKFRKPAQ
jgi:predicted methyltransferase